MAPLDIRRREPAYIPAAPTPETQAPATVGAPSDVGEAAPIEDARPLDQRVAAWTERTAGDAPLTRTGETAGDRPAVRTVGAPGVAPRSGDAPSGLDSLLREHARTRTTGIAGDRILLAQVVPRDRPNVATDAPTGLQVGNAPSGTPRAPGQQGVIQPAAPAVTGPSTPQPAVDIARLEAANTRVQAFRTDRSPLPQAETRAIQQHFQAATEAARRGDHAAVERELAACGFPIGDPASRAAGMSAVMLGATQATATANGGWQTGTFRTGSGGHQGLNDVNGFAANARMMEGMRAAGIPANNPPTEAQALAYMRHVSQPGAGGAAADPAAIMQSAGRVVDGSIVHYSSAGRSDPQYDANPNPRFFFRDRAGAVREFDSAAAARTAAAGERPPIPARSITRMDTRSPDAWSDVSSQGTRAGRQVGDCESKLYMQQRLLTAAGMTSLGSVDVRQGTGIGHMFGVFRSQDGRVFVTSNEQHQEVRGTGPNGRVTQADLERTLRAMTADVYHVQPNAAGVRDTSGFRFSMARTDPAGGTDAPVASIRRASELSIQRRSEDLL